jgi:predicted MPP superfamily phosphohydrolase
LKKQNEKMKKKSLIILFTFIQATTLALNVPFINFGSGTTQQGSSWSYLDNGSNPDASWKNLSYDDSLWKTGNSELGYGETDQNTTVSYGTDVNNRYITTFFRKTIIIENINQFVAFIMKVKRDDGVAVYVNGNNAFIDNLPSTYNHLTLASLAGDDGNTAITKILDTSLFVEGINIISVEMHQSSITSSDLTFDMELVGATQANVTRGPYLQVGTIDGITIRWRTDINATSKVTLGTNINNYTISSEDAILKTEHIVRVNSLTPDTKYYYTIGTQNYVIQGDVNNNFTTLPLENTKRKLRFFALGDCGNNSPNQINVKNSLINYIGNNSIDGMLLLGDNAYDVGSDSEYQTKFFDIYKNDLLKYYKLYPAPGNHDYGNNAANTGLRNLPYHLSFSVPQNGEIGGVPSGVSNYYSYDIGNVHFISLDSYGQDDNNTTKMYDINGAQATWLQTDLNANQKKWTVAYFHHPPYTKTSHNSDTELDLVAIRERFVRLLEQKGVDLVLCGHSHGYERSYLLKEYYNNYSAPLQSAQFDALLHTATKSIQNAAYDGTPNSCAYAYDSGAYNHGSIYVVSGSAGKVGGQSAGYPHKCMHYSNTTNGGAIYFEVEDNRLDAKFISYDTASPSTPIVRDSFTIFKDVNKSTSINTSLNSQTTLEASWIGQYNWSTNENTKAITINNAAIGNFVYEVEDDYKCVKDTFTINVTDPLSNNSFENYTVFSFYPNPTTGKIKILTSLESINSFKIISFDGKSIQEGTINNDEIDVSELKPGVYFIYFENDKNSIIKKIIKM